MSGGPAILLFSDELEHASGNFDLSIRSRLHAVIPVEIVFNDQDALRVLKTHDCRLAILEHLVGYTGLVDANAHYENLEFHSVDEFLPAFIQASASTRYVVTCHVKGCGIGKEREWYEPFPQVIRTLGSLQTEKHARFVLKTIEGLYADV